MSNEFDIAYYLLEDSSGHYQLEDSSGSLLEELQDYAGLIVEDGAIAYWRLGEPSGTVAADAVRSNTGTYVGSPTLGVVGALVGNSNTAATFSATQYVTAPAISGMADGPASIEFWMKRVDLGNGFKLLVHRGTGSFSMGMNDSNGDGRIEIYKYGSVDLCRGSVLINDATYWHHIVGTKPAVGLGEPKIYIDGVDVTVLITTNQSTTDPGTTTGIAAIADGTFPFVGSLDEVALYSVVLTAAQVARHYRCGIQYFDTGIGMPTPAQYPQLLAQ